ncbi:MAG: FkbM family methyltransferase [Verrucomicrobiota bacterium]
MNDTPPRPPAASGAESFLNRLSAGILKRLVTLFSHLPMAGKINLRDIMENQTERILNLPGMLPFFPTRMTELGRISSLLHSLHPVSCSKPLIRLGADSDGGYLVPDDLDGIVACFSPGVSDNSGFELSLAERGIPIFLADASVDAPAVKHEKFHFQKKFVGGATHGDFVTLEDWIESCLRGGDGDLLLQMDIEGFEYESILATSGDAIRRFRIIVIEFHFLDRLFSEPCFELYAKVFEKLLLTHRCVHIHPNNVCGTIRVGKFEIPQMAEFTFYGNDRILNADFVSNYPHPLDQDNVPENPHVILPASCYRSTV